MLSFPSHGARMAQTRPALSFYVLTNERIDNTNLIGELATVTAERDRYKAVHENPQPLTLEEVKEHITKGHPNDIKPLYVDFKRSWQKSLL